MYSSLAATSETLRSYLQTGMLSGPAALATFFTGANTSVSLATPQEMVAAGEQGLSLWLYRVVRDESRLNDPPTVRPLPSGRIEITPPPLPLRLHYLLTPLANTAPDTEHRILGLAMQLFHSQPVLSGALLRSDLAGSEAQVIVRLEALALEEIARVWEALAGSYQLCVSYEVTLANINSVAIPMVEAPVESVTPEYALIFGSES
jgi:hypothetical protein